MSNTIHSIVKTYTQTPKQVNELSYWLIKKYYGLNKAEFYKIGIEVPKEKQPSKIALKSLLLIEANHAHLFLTNSYRGSSKSVKVINA